MDAIVLGRGNVAMALLRLLKDTHFPWSERLRITGIASRRGGIEEAGISFAGQPGQLPAAGNATAAISAGRSDGTTTEEITRWIERHSAHLVIDTTSLDSTDFLATLPYVQAALSAGKHVITANKGPVALRYFELARTAAAAKVQFLFKATVMDGVPVLDFPRWMLPGCRLKSFRGVLNSTTNVILDQVASGRRFQTALDYCRSIGVTEGDPSHDLEGKDAALKIAICAQHFWQQPVALGEIARVALDGDVMPPPAGKRWRIICRGYPGGGQMELSAVAPEDLMYSIEGTSNALEFETDLMGRISIAEIHPGLTQTAYGIVYDLWKILGQ
ncbi:MAG TPA: hypothetical protein VGL91_06220 [Acidobacteriota bacterium]|jgi:homoserine dehydrogenase